LDLARTEATKDLCQRLDVTSRQNDLKAWTAWAGTHCCLVWLCFVLLLRCW